MNNLATRLATGQPPAGQPEQPGTALAQRAGAAPAVTASGGLPAKLEYARALAVAGMLPAQYRERPGNILWAIEYGEMLGISTMAAITGVHVIEGKPSASASLISALVRRAGHRLRIHGNADRAVCVIVRSDDPDYEFRVEWNVDRAQQAGLLNKDNWKKYRPAMLKARAITECARDACPEALMGMLYTPDELGAEVDIDDIPVAAAGPAAPPVVPVGAPAFSLDRPSATAFEPERPGARTAPALQTEFPPVAGKGDDEPSATGQRTAMTRLLAKGGITTDADALAVLARIAGRTATVAHLDRLTAREARQVIEHLDGWQRGSILAEQLAAVLAAAQPEPIPDAETDPASWHADGHPRRQDDGTVARVDIDQTGCEWCAD